MPRYAIYARKSTESEDRQVLSIDSQIRELSMHAREQGYTVVRVYSESRSAKTPGRPVFSGMLQQLPQQRIDGILCWKLDRLARNPVDGGALIWAIEEGSIGYIATPSRVFANDGNDKFWMQLEFGMAKKYVDDLADNVKRGNRAKLEQGWLPGAAPLGYLNDRTNKTIIKDPQRFPLVRRMWDQLLAGARPPAILAMANDEWGFRTRQTRRIGGKPLVLSVLYRLFGNPFYYGMIRRNGQSYEGAHEAMITRDEFDTAQQILRRPERPRLRRHEWAYTGFIRCGECGGAVTAEHKTNRYGSHYIYYHCTKRRANTKCEQKVIQLEVLEAQMRGFLLRIHLDDKTCSWALVRLQNTVKSAREQEERAATMLQQSLANMERKLARLTDIRVSGLISDDEFAHKRRGLVSERLDIRSQIEGHDTDRERWFELSEKAFLLSNFAPKRFDEGNNAEKKELLLAVGSNYTLTNGILRIQAREPFSVSNDTGHIPDWCTRWEAIRTFFEKHPHSIQWPSFCNDPKVLQRWRRRMLRKTTTKRKKKRGGRRRLTKA